MAMDARHHHHHLPSKLALALFLAFALAPLAAGDPLGKMCGSSGNYTANSTYQSNIRGLSTTLPKDASTSPTLFATAKLGSVPNIVYALALCRGDVNASACASCVAAAFTDAQQLCAYNMDATVFYDFCFLRYSNQDFTSSPTSDGRGNVLILMNTQNVTAPFKVFDAAVSALVNATIDYAASNSSKRFGTGVEAFRNFDSSNPSIYALAQCTPDMAPADCRSCLTGLTQWAPNTPLLQLPEPVVGAPAPAPAPPVNGTPPTTGGGGGRGRRNGGSYSTDESADLLSLVWEHWTTGTLMEIMDSSLSSLAPRDQMLKCIHIGLLCVQDDPAERPMMSTVNVMLSSSTVTLQAPSRPVFCIQKSGSNSEMYSEVYPGAPHSESRSPISLNDVSITELEAR
nr:unnamed protein product [Digitaria exilis]